MDPVDFSEYAPRRVRADRQKTEVLPAAPKLETPLSEEIKQNALRFSTMVQNLQENERRALAENVELKARLEQFQSAVTDLKSQIETAKLEIQDVRARSVRLMVILENIGGLVADGIQP